MRIQERKFQEERREERKKMPNLLFIANWRILGMNGGEIFHNFMYYVKNEGKGREGKRRREEGENGAKKEEAEREKAKRLLSRLKAVKWR